MEEALAVLRPRGKPTASDERGEVEINESRKGILRIKTTEIMQRRKKKEEEKT
jgi:hypothetical protein